MCCENSIHRRNNRRLGGRWSSDWPDSSTRFSSRIVAARGGFYSQRRGRSTAARPPLTAHRLITEEPTFCFVHPFQKADFTGK
ncbi:hypothetical protein RRG08_055415 [Elysia crispata]|uniref:Uncharacterized protein n=1 Tax=Elysia crispata TaxID=231223 RepID=A0AAE1AQT0_9GAST|nr:hypothetical protein RRG08_055415 [Elysia crispata]